MRVKLISQEQNVYEIEYYQVNDFCKMLCYQEDNIAKFMEFKKDYTYFDAYFDFVIFELGYKMENALFEGKIIEAIGNEIFTEDKLKKGNKFAYMTKCSDSILRIEKCDRFNRDCLFDCNGYSMMGYMEANNRGNHNVTSRTILNQVYIQDEKFCNYFEDSGINSIDIINSLGFFRVATYEDCAFIIGLENIMTSLQYDVLKNRTIEYLGEAEEIEKQFVYDYSKITNKGNRLKKTIWR